jgi:hypothetical protein
MPRINKRLTFAKINTQYFNISVKKIITIITNNSINLILVIK